jgi:site-specific recombinase XerD
MKDVYARLEEDYDLRGLSAKSRKAYLSAVRQLGKHCGRPPDELGDGDVRDFFLHLINVKRASPSTVSQKLYAIKFLFEVTLRRRLECLKTLRPRKTRRLPVVLSVPEVRSILRRIRVPRIRACMTVIYSCGLRLLEGTHLRAAQIDGDRMFLRVESGKGDKDRYVPLPSRTLGLLRVYWRDERPLHLAELPACKAALSPHDALFPAGGEGGVVGATSVQKAMKLAVAECGIAKDATVHTLRHSYATHLLERGVPLPVIQELLGHRSPRTTLVYTHLTEPSVVRVRETIDELMADL